MWNKVTVNPVVIMPYYPDTLEVYLKKKDRDTDELITLCHQLALGVEHMHKCRVKHRDIKLQNIMVDKDGKPKFMDFGESTIK